MDPSIIGGQQQQPQREQQQQQVDEVVSSDMDHATAVGIAWRECPPPWSFSNWNYQTDLACSPEERNAIHEYGVDLQRRAWAIVVAAQHQRDTADVNAQQVEVRADRRGVPAKKSSAQPSSQTSLLELSSSENSAILSMQQPPPKQIADTSRRDENGVDELKQMEEGRRMEEQELVSVEPESPLPPLWAEESGCWWLDRVPSETPTPMSPLERVGNNGGVPELGSAKRNKHQQKQESSLATWPDEQKEQEELAETLVQQQQPISQSPPLSPPLPPPPPTPDESVWMIRRRRRRTKGVGRARVTGGVVAQHGRSRSSRPRRARVREK